MIKDILVVGSGSAGLISALCIRRRLPQVNVRIVRDPDIPVIGVGEGTTPNFPALIFDFLGIQRKTFYQLAEPSWKLGIRFKWGVRGHFDYTFAPQLDSRYPDLPRPNGFYCEDDFSYAHITSSLMEEGKVFPRQPNGSPNIHPAHAFHIENEKFVSMLEKIAAASGVETIDGSLDGVERGENGISAIVLKDGRKLEADFFIDCSGFRSELIGRVFETPFLSFDKTLFCDRAVVGGWNRTVEPILPYTTAEQMSTGWCWKIEHVNRINRGYVYCSDMISDEEAEREFRERNPKVGNTRIVKFRSGCYQRTWVENVVAIGNSAGFVEPLEATALMVVSLHARSFVDALANCELNPTPSIRELYNDLTHPTWLGIRDFLGLHYKPNTSLDTPFWQRCREETDLSGIAELLEFYEENGPIQLARHALPGDHTQNDFGLEGYLCMLVGMKAPHRAHYQPTPQEMAVWQQHRQQNMAIARQSMTVEESLAYVNHPGWQWHGDQPQSAAAG